MRFFTLCGALFLGTVFTVYTVLQDGSLLRYLDTHPHPSRVPAVEYYIGGGYYIFGSLPKAATYYLRVAERYPKSSYADKAYFYYLQSLDDMNIPRWEMADKYTTYLQRFPDGEHVEIVQKRIEYCRNAR